MTLKQTVQGLLYPTQSAEKRNQSRAVAPFSFSTPTAVSHKGYRTDRPARLSHTVALLEKTAAKDRRVEGIECKEARRMPSLLRRVVCLVRAVQLPGAPALSR